MVKIYIIEASIVNAIACLLCFIVAFGQLVVGDFLMAFLWFVISAVNGVMAVKAQPKEHQ